MRFEELYKFIKKEYCNLFSFKVHGNGRTLEILTPNTTITDKFISVFLTLRNDKFIVTDGGWIESNIYGSDFFDDDPDIAQSLINQYSKYYQIKITLSPSNSKVFYKETTDKAMIPALVFDLANFISGAVNVHSLELKEKKDKEERDKFKSNTNEYLKDVYKEQFYPREEIDGIKFNAVIKESSTLHLIEYVTGSSLGYFENDLRKAAVNFNIISESRMSKYVGEKIAILNNNSFGFTNNPSKVLMDFLHRNSTKDFLTWESKGQIIKLVNPN